MVKQNLLIYHIYSAIRQGFLLSIITINNLISSIKFGYNTSFTLPKQFQSSSSVLDLDRS